ncbi:MAG: hypothetical protein QM754_18315 [Tepidisphaeraceae bacterium]
MKGNRQDITDLTRGVYRRIYSGYLAGRRINRLSHEAEAWFWRVHAAADDFGNQLADLSALYSATAGRRAGKVTLDQVAGWVGEMVTERLLLTYEVAGEQYHHVAEWELMQPAPANGRRARRVPESPWDKPEAVTGADSRDTDEASKPKKQERSVGGGVPVNPDESGLHNHQDHHHHQDQSKPAAQVSAEVAASDSTATQSSPVALVYPCVGNPKSWNLHQSGVDRLSQHFPSLDVLAECRAALAWCEANPRGRKTASGMKRFITSWLTTANNDPRRRARSSADAATNPEPPRGGIKDRALATLKGRS